MTTEGGNVQGEDWGGRTTRTVLSLISDEIPVQKKKVGVEEGGGGGGGVESGGGATREQSV